MLSVFVRDLLVGCPKGAVFRVNKLVDKKRCKLFCCVLEKYGETSSVCVLAGFSE